MTPKPTYEELEKQIALLEKKSIHRKRFEEINHTLFKISDAVNTTPNLDELFRTIHLALSAIIDTTNFYIALYDEPNDSLTFPYFVDSVDNCNPPEIEICKIESITAEVIRTGRPVMVNKADRLSQRAKTSLVIPPYTPSEIWLGVPLKIQNIIIGVMAVQNYQDPKCFDQTDIDVMVSVADQVATAIERKQAEEALSRSEHHLSEAQHIAKIGNWNNDIRTNTVTWSDELFEIFGIDRSLFGSTYKSFIDRVHPDDRELVIATNRDARNNLKSFDIEYRVVLPDGEVRIIHELGSGEFDKEGTATRLFGVAQDITELKQSQNALQKSELLFRLLAETIQDVFWISTVGVHKMLYISPAYEKLWERSTESLYQSPLSFLEAIHPEDLDGLKEIVNKYHGVGKEYECYYRIIRKNEEIRWIHERGFPVNHLFDSQQVMVGVCKDVTDQKNMEIALQKSQELYQSVVEDQTEIISRFKPDGTFTFVNETCCRFFGKSARDLIGTQWMPLALEDDLPRIYRQLQNISAENPVVVLENRVWDAAGRKRWMQFVNHSYYDEKGSLSEIQSVGRDITSIKEKEQLLHKSQKEIQNQAKNLKKINMAMEVLLDRRNRQLEELKENMFRNFNKLILPNLSSLKDRLKTESNKRLVSLIIQNIESLLSSDLDRLTSERFGLSKTELKVATMIKSDMTSAEIAGQLGISINTVGFHRKNLRKKLNIHKSKTPLSHYLKHHL